MKKLLKPFTLMAIMLSAFIFSAQAQTKAVADTNKVHRMHHRMQAFKAFKDKLTADQQAMLKQNREKQKAAMVAFRATLTDDQKAIMKDKALARKDRHAKLVASYTLAQKDMLAANKAARKASRQAFLATLTDAQKAEMKEMFKGKREHGGFRRHKADKTDKA